MLIGKPAARPADADPAGKPSLAPDLWDLVGRSQPYWAGNINVFVGNRAVERHFARALRIYPGFTNLAMFLVGSPGTREAFAFEVLGLPTSWSAVLFNATNRSNLLVGPSDSPLEELEWVESNGSLMLLLSVHPPPDCTTGNLEVRVTRRTSRKRAVVEFTLDPAAQGTGCYYV